MSAHVLPTGWVMELPGYAVDMGQTKAERGMSGVVRYCDARGGTLKTWAHDGAGIPHAVALACIEAAADWPAEFRA
jgi:hypothetical protein